MPGSVALGLANLVADGFAMGAGNDSRTTAELGDYRKLLAAERKYIVIEPSGGVGDRPVEQLCRTRLTYRSHPSRPDHVYHYHAGLVASLPDWKALISTGLARVAALFRRKFTALYTRVLCIPGAST